jgi:hypothetical protein
MNLKVEIESQQDILFFAINVQTDSQVGLSPGLRRPDHESDYSSVSIAKV